MIHHSLTQPGGIEFCGMIVVMRDGLFVSM